MYVFFSTGEVRLPSVGRSTSVAAGDIEERSEEGKDKNDDEEKNINISRSASANAGEDIDGGRGLSQDRDDKSKDNDEEGEAQSKPSSDHGNLSSVSKWFVYLHLL